LRDMVERQQYELRKMQRSLQENKKPTESGLQSQSPLNSNIKSPPASAVNSGNAVLDGNALTSAEAPTISSPQTTAIDASVVPTAPTLNTEQKNTITANSNAVTQSVPETVTATNRTTPSPTEVRKPATAAPQSSSRPVIQADGSIVSASDAVINPTSSVVTQEVPAVIDIKPIETINAASVDAPSSVTTQPNNVVSSTTNEINPSQELKTISENDYYQQGFNLLKESKHAEAVTVFQQQIKSYPQGDRADDAYYWIAESMYVNRKLDISKENFKAIVQGYPKSERLPDAMLKLAYIEQEQGNIIETRILLQEIMQFHPNSDAALSAKNKLSELN